MLTGANHIYELGLSISWWGLLRYPQVESRANGHGASFYALPLALPGVQFINLLSSEFFP